MWNAKYELSVYYHLRLSGWAVNLHNDNSTFQKPVKLPKLQDRTQFGLSSHPLFRKSGFNYNCPFYCLLKRSCLQLPLQSPKDYHEALLLLFLPAEGHCGRWKCSLSLLSCPGLWWSSRLHRRSKEGVRKIGSRCKVHCVWPTFWGANAATTNIIL